MDMNKNDIIKYLAIAGGAYLAYWYVTNHGPNGAVYAADGTTKVNPSFWDSWFGGTATPTAVAPSAIPPATLTAAQLAAKQLADAQAKCIAPNQWNGTNGVCVPPVQTTSATTLINHVASQILAKANANNSTQYDADQWGYFYNQIYTPLTPNQFGAAFPTRPSGNMTAAQWVTAVATSQGWTDTTALSGMGDIVRVPSISSVPMMSFGGAGFSPFGGKKGWS